MLYTMGLQTFPGSWIQVPISLTNNFVFFAYLHLSYFHTDNLFQNLTLVPLPADWRNHSSTANQPGTSLPAPICPFAETFWCHRHFSHNKAGSLSNGLRGASRFRRLHLPGPELVAAAGWKPSTCLGWFPHSLGTLIPCSFSPQLVSVPAEQAGQPVLRQNTALGQPALPAAGSPELLPVH